MDVHAIYDTTVTADWNAKGYRLPTEAETPARWQ
jgi:hypothetical protein